jgi:hypothetical protein
MQGKKGKPYEGIPWLKIMIAIEVIILLELLFHGIAGVITKWKNQSIWYHRMPVLMEISS